MLSYKGTAVTPDWVQMLRDPRVKEVPFFSFLLSLPASFSFRCSVNHSKLPSEWGALLSLMTHMPLLAGTGALLPPLLTHSSPEKKQKKHLGCNNCRFLPQIQTSPHSPSGWGLMRPPTLPRGKEMRRAVCGVVTAAARVMALRWMSLRTGLRCSCGTLPRTQQGLGEVFANE